MLEPAGSAGKQTPFVSRIFSPGPGIEGPDVPQIFSQVGKGWKRIFTASKNLPEKKTEIQTPVAKTQTPAAEIQTSNSKTDFGILLLNDHQFSFGMVYANDLAKAEIEKEDPNFPVGAIIVREKNETAASETPQTVIAMVKREKGFSEKTGDWEFFVFNGADLKLNSRETVGNCAACHIQAEKTDWVFRDYLK